MNNTLSDEEGHEEEEQEEDLTHQYIQGVTGGKDQTSGGCSLC